MANIVPYVMLSDLRNCS